MCVFTLDPGIWLEPEPRVQLDAGVVHGARHVLVEGGRKPVIEDGDGAIRLRRRAGDDDRRDPRADRDAPLRPPPSRPASDSQALPQPRRSLLPCRT
jgi:hypothetical protein